MWYAIAAMVFFLTIFAGGLYSPIRQSDTMELYVYIACGFAGAISLAVAFILGIMRLIS